MSLWFGFGAFKTCITPDIKSLNYTEKKSSPNPHGLILPDESTSHLHSRLLPSFRGAEIRWAESTGASPPAVLLLPQGGRLGTWICAAEGVRSSRPEAPGQIADGVLRDPALAFAFV